MRTGNEAKFESMAKILASAEDAAPLNPVQALALLAAVKKSIQSTLAMRASAIANRQHSNAGRAIGT